MIPEETIEAIRAAADIVDLVGERVELKGSGDNLKARCPFHNEKTPSFNVNRQRNSFYCFGCQEGGDPFGWLMKMDGLTFVEAIRKLGERYGIPVEEDGSGPSNRGPVLAANQIAMRFYKELLHRSRRADRGRSYLKERGIHHELATTFGLGYAPGGTALRQKLRKERVSDDIALSAGLLRRGTNGEPIDWFRDRVVFPILNPARKVVGFGARALGDAQPKYLNTPESPIFSKRRELYGVHLLKAPEKNKPLLICEGYTDVMFCHLHGFERAVAGLGTAFTEGQGKLVRRFAKSVILLYDADNAGLKAAEKSARILEPLGVEVRVAVLEDGLDPCDYLTRFGAPALRARLDAAEPFLSFKASRVLDEGSARGNVQAARELLDIVRDDQDPLRRARKLQNISEWTGLDETSLRQYLSKPSRPARRQAPERERAPAAEPPDAFERRLVLAIVQNPDAHAQLADWIAPDDVADPDLREIVVTILQRKVACSVEELRALVVVPGAQSVIAEAALGGVHWPIADVRKRFQERQIDERLGWIQRRMKRAQQDGNQVAVDRLLREYLALKERRKAL